MRASELSQPVWDWIVSALGESDATVVLQSIMALKGGMSSSLYLLELRVNSTPRKVVLRQFTNQEWVQHEPDLALHEAGSLQRALRVSVPTPEVLAFAETGVQEEGIPLVLMTLVPGVVELQPRDLGVWLYRLAESLVQIHRVEPEDFAWKYRTYNDVSSLGVPEWSARADSWKEALDILRQPRPHARECFLHRDFHPTNVLWQEEQVSGIVDWVNACRGPAGIDVGHCRLNLVQLYGVQAADQFLAAYQELAGTDFEYDPYWDLLSLIEVLPGPPEVYQGWVDLGITDLTDELINTKA